MKKYYHYLLIIIALVFISIRPLVLLYQQRETFFYKGYLQQYNSFRSAYYTSQYVQKKNPGIIPDQTFEAFAAGAFLKGMNPILINHDQPPMGRYILSLSIFLFDNVNTIMIPLLLLSLLGIFLISKIILKSTLVSLVPIAIFINEPLFLNKLTTSPLLEPIQLPFIIFSLYFFIQAITKKNYKKWLILTSIMLGFVISTRFFILGLFLLLSMGVFFLIERKKYKKGIVFLMTLPIVLLVLLLSYTRTIQSGESILHVIGIQKYIYYYHKSQLTLPFSFWDLLIFNKWHTWWGNRTITSDEQWILVWPITTFMAFLFILLSLFKKILISDAEKIIFSWIVMYSVFLSMGIVSTRYFIPLLPFLYIITVDFLIKTLPMFKAYIKR